MADNTANNTQSSGGNGAMAFILGGVVVALGVLGYIVFAGGDLLPASGGDDVTITIDGGAGAAEEAAGALEGAATAVEEAVTPAGD
ncbi:MAG: hypothetical protein AAGF60_06365 [Pseudomonadota bacterium]